MRPARSLFVIGRTHLDPRASQLTPAGLLVCCALLAVVIVVSGLFAAYYQGRRDAERDGYVEGAFAAGWDAVQQAGKLESLVRATRVRLVSRVRARPVVQKVPVDTVPRDSSALGR